MKRVVLLSILFSFIYANCLSQNLKVNGKYLINDSGNEVILRGMGLGGWMLQEGYMLQLSSVANAQHEIRTKIEAEIGPDKTDEFYSAWLNNHTTKKDIDSLKSWGFNSIRLPLHYNLFTLPIQDEPVAGEQTWLEKGFALTDSLLKWCSENEMYLILDLHAAPGGQGRDAAISDYNSLFPSLWESEENIQKTIALWTKLADRYKDEPWMGGYDLLNEPNWGFSNPSDLNGCLETTNTPLRNLLIDLTNAIRSVDPNHVIFIEGNCWANNYSGMFPLWDNNMVLSFHKYWSYNDVESIQWILDFRNTYNVPIWLGESGENSNTWYKDAIEMMEENHIGWAWWPLKKVGLNNILQIRKNEGFGKLIDYWEGKAGSVKPTTQASIDALMQLAEDSRIENTEFHPDVIDAMIRQPASDTNIPYKPHQVTQDGYILFAVDFDMGQAGSAYHDNIVANYHLSSDNYTAWNNGWNYRNDGVDIENCQDVQSNGYSIGWFQKDEWLSYSLQVETEGNYNLSFRTATTNSQSKMQLEINGFPLDNIISVPSSGGWQNWIDVIATGVYFRKGENTLKIYSRGTEFNLNYIQFSSPIDMGDSKPFLNSAMIGPDSNVIKLNFDQPMQPLTDPALIQVRINDSTFIMDQLELAGYSRNILHLNHTKHISYGDVVELSYSGNEIKGANGLLVEPISSYPVKINMTNPESQLKIPGKMEAEMASRNHGFRSDACQDIDGGLYLGWADQGNYLIYDTEVTQTGTYQLQTRYASQGFTSKFLLTEITETGENLLTEVTLPSTGNWQKWQSILSQEFQLTKGTSQIKLEVKSGAFNLNWLEFKLINVPEESEFQVIAASSNIIGDKVFIEFNQAIQEESIQYTDFMMVINGQSSELISAQISENKFIELITAEPIKEGDIVKVSYPNGGLLSISNKNLQPFNYQWVENNVFNVEAMTLPGKIEMEDFSYNNGFSFESCSDIGGGENAGYTDSGDYLDFDVFVTSSGEYTVKFRVAAESATGKIRFEDVTDGQTQLLAQISFPPTGGWQNWTTISERIELVEGFRKLRIKAAASLFNINWFEVEEYVLNISEIEKSEIHIYPNPSTSMFQISGVENLGSDLRINLFDLQGKAQSIDVQAQGSGEMKIIHNLPKGLYLLEMRSSSKSFRTRILIY